MRQLKLKQTNRSRRPDIAGRLKALMAVGVSICLVKLLDANPSCIFQRSEAHYYRLGNFSQLDEREFADRRLKI